MAVELQNRKRVTTELKSWLDDVTAYEKEFKRWEGRVEKILKRYRDESRKEGDSSAKFNILWSNIQTLSAATFSKVPKPDVSRRFRDNDPVGRVASLILERGLDFHIQHYPDYRETLRACVLDRFLGGRGTAWVRYEPHFKAVENVQITEDVESEEELDYECAAVDYVHWKDYGQSVARTNEESNRRWRKVYMTKEAMEERFGEEKAKLVPMDASPKEVTGGMKPADAIDRACIYEGWDKAKKEAVWFSTGVKDFLDTLPDPLKLEGFYPCPKPLYATLTNESLVPVPDFTLYQDQANELDTLCDRIDGLVKALQVKGVYDGSLGVEIARIFTEGESNTLLPIKNWQAFAEKNGLSGAIDLLEILPIAQALAHAYEAFEQIKQQVYEITGISDIVRGQTEASETATAQQIKGQYASLRIKTYQEEVARFATELLQIMAQVMCGKFDPQTLLSLSAADQLSDTDKQMIPQALALLVGENRVQNPAEDQGPNPLRSFRVEVAADTLVYMDEQGEKQDRVEFLTAVGSYMEKAAAVGAQAPQVVPLVMELLKFGITGFRVGKNIEGTIDEAIEQLKQAAANPQQKPDPEMAKVQAQQASDQAKQQHEQQRLAHDQQVAQLEHEREQMRIQAESASRERQAQIQAQVDQHRNTLEIQRDNFSKQADMDFQRWKSELEARTKIEIAEITANASLQADQARAATEAAKGEQVKADKEAQAKEPKPQAQPIKIDNHIHLPSSKRTITTPKGDKYTSEDA